jgi:hypothetical protein
MDAGSRIFALDLYHLFDARSMKMFSLEEYRKAFGAFSHAATAAGSPKC